MVVIRYEKLVLGALDTNSLSYKSVILSNIFKVL